jgi:hypothetical protein
MKKQVVKDTVFGGKLGWIVFFFDVFLALMIITSAGYLVRTEFGRVSLIFGFFMLALTVILRAVSGRRISVK